MLRLFFSGILFMLFSAISMYASVNSISRSMEKLDFTKAKYTIDKEFAGDTQNYAYHFLYAKYYFNQANKENNLSAALNQINKCSVKYRSNNNAKLLLVNDKLLINSAAINSLYHQIELEYFYTTLRSNSLLDYESSLAEPFVDTFIISSMTRHRNELAFSAANTKNDFISFKEFMEKYPNANQAGLAKENYEKLLYKSILNTNTWQAFRSYLDQNDSSIYRFDATERYEKLLYEDYSKNKDTARLYSYISDYPNAKYIRNAEISLFKIICADLSTSSFSKYISSYPNSHFGVQKAWDYIYLYSTSSDIPEAYVSFASKYPTYYNYKRFQSDSLLSYLKLIPFESNHLFGFMSGDTMVAIPAMYQEVGDFGAKLAFVAVKCADDKCIYSYINKHNERLPVLYNEAYDFADGVAIVGVGDCPEKNCRYGLINELGDTISNLIYSEILEESCGLFLVTDTEEKSGYMNNRGQISIPIRFNKARSFKDSVACVSIDSSIFFINQHGVRQSQLPAFIQATDFNQHLASYSSDGLLWGVMNTEGKIIHAPIYSGPIIFEEGVAFAKKMDTITNRGKTTNVLRTYELTTEGSAKIKK